MNIVVDAQILQSFFIETVLEIDSNLTSSAQRVFQRIGQEDIAYLDSGGQIQQEWSDLVDPEWFDPWLAKQLNDDAIIKIETRTCPEILRAIINLGFPRGSKDIWYIRTAKALVDTFGNNLRRREIACFLISEDLDLHDPRSKKSVTSERRIEILLSDNGPVSRYLRRNEHISINCVASYLQEVFDF